MQKQINTKTACKILGVCRNTLIEWNKNGKLKPSSVTEGGHRRYLLHDIYKFMGMNCEQIEKELEKWE